MRTYSELITIPTFEERLSYLLIGNGVGDMTFGGSRYLNQDFYHSSEWRKIRRDVILRDNGFDLAFPDRPIFGKLLIHHIEPITIDDLKSWSNKIYDFDNLVCVSQITHNSIHYGSSDILSPCDFTERMPNDTCPWKGGMM